jgi:hypothetical protein
MKIANWRDYIKNRSKWKEFVEKSKTSSKLSRLKKKKKKKNVHMNCSQTVLNQTKPMRG